MAQERPLSPEKQLLKLIEEPSHKAVNIQAQAIQHIGLSFLSWGAWSGRFSFYKSHLAKYFKELSLQKFDVKLINRVQAAFIFIMTIFFISNLSSSILGLKRAASLEFKIQNSTETLADIEQNLILNKASSYYLEKVRQRDIFKMGLKETPAASVNAPKAPTSKIMEATQSLKLVGISWSHNPDAMIEDTKALRTFFVTRGQMIGTIKVGAIFKDKVVLTYGGEEIELK